MKNIFYIVFLISILPAREIYKQVRVYIESENTISILQTAGMDVDHSYRKADKWIEFAVSESNIYLLDKTQLSYDIIHENLEGKYRYPILSLLSALFGYFMIIITVAAAYGQSGSSEFYLVITIIAMIGAIVLGLIGLSKKKWLSILGFLLGFLGFLMVIGSK